MVWVWSMEEIIIHNGFIINILLHKRVMDFIVIWTQELHSEMESCNKYQHFGSMISTHDVSPDPQQTSPGPYLYYLWSSLILTSMCCT